MDRSEQRAEQRYWVHRTAKVVSGDEALVECTVLDVSRSGLRIGIGGWHLLPERFHLVDAARRTAYEARVVWRRPQEAGLLIESDLSAWWFSSTPLSVH